MPAATSSALCAVRFAGDIAARVAIEADRDLSKVLADSRAVITAHPTRQRVLSSAVRVSPRLLPQVDGVFRDVAQRARIDEPLELYVSASSDINACVMPAQHRILVMLTSSAIERLEPDELAFVIGHELGHAVFGHLEVPVQWLIERTAINARQSMQLFAWSRKSEISADRAGLVCCGDLEIAASALFKSLSGLSLKGHRIDPHEFAAQWDELAAEMARDAADESWRSFHPFPPLRMKALLLFWNSDGARRVASGETTPALTEADRSLERWLAMMDPLARGTGSGADDPMLSDFLLWGGLYVATANGVVTPAEVRNLCEVVGQEPVERALAEVETDADRCREQFLIAKSGRRRKLRALEMHTIFTALAAVARADGLVDEPERQALHDLAQDCGVATAFVDNLLASC